LAGAPELNPVPPRNFPFDLSAHDDFARDYVAFTLPFGPMVKQLFVVRLSFPSTTPSTKRSSLPVTSPLILIPWLMHAAAGDELGSPPDAKAYWREHCWTNWQNLREMPLCRKLLQASNLLFSTSDTSTSKTGFSKPLIAGWLDCD